jgi:hypothetical protein
MHQLPNPSAPGRQYSGRSRLFVIESGYLLALAAIFIAYHVSDSLRHALPASFGGLPIGVPWFGAVGATLISLTGIFKHAHDWNIDYELWHYARPLIGGFLGSIGALMFSVIVNTAAVKAQQTNGAVYEVVAFLLGYREATFRSLIQRATDLLLSPSSGTSRPARPEPPSPARPSGEQ